MKQKTCLLIKPDGVAKKVVGKILERFETEGMDLIALKMVLPDKNKYEAFYSVHKGKLFYDSFMEFMMEGPSVATIWEGENVIERCRKIIGATDSKKAEPGTLRNLYGTDNRRNLVHASDSQTSAENEISVMFDKHEIASLVKI